MKSLLKVVAAVAAVCGFAAVGSADDLCWRLSGTIITDDETNWKFNVKTDFSYDDGVETFTGLQIKSANRAGTGTVVDLRNKKIVDGSGNELVLRAFGDGSQFANITELYLPDTVVYLGNNAFNQKGIVKIVPGLPDSVRFIGKSAFYRAGSFAGDGTGTLRIGGGGHPFSWASNAGDDFDRDYALKQLVFGAGVTNIPNQQFLTCSGITNVVFQAEGLTTLGDSAFQACSALVGITPELPKTVTYFGGSAFYGCSALKSIRLGGEQPMTFGGVTWLFRANAITSVVIGAGVDLPSSGSIFENDGGEGVLKYITCEGYPQNLTKAFARHRYNYQHLYIVPDENKDWKDYLAENNFVAWSNVATNVRSGYYTTFGAEAPEPSGTAKFQNAMVQFVLLKAGQVEGVKRLNVASAPNNIGIAKMTPSFGEHADVSDELPLACAVAPGEVYSADGTIAYECFGYKLYRWNGDDWDEYGEDTATSFAYNPAADGYEKIEWQWAPVAYKLTVNYPSKLGRVDQSGTEYAPGCYAPGTVVTLTVTATNSAPFVRWYGDVPAGQNPTSPTLTVTVDGPTTLVPYFKNNWTYTYNTSRCYINDGYWTVCVKSATSDAKMLYTQNGDATAVTSKLDASMDELDLSKPINDGYTLYALGLKTFRYCGFGFTRLILPETLTEIGDNVFDGFTTVKEIVFNSGMPTISGVAFGSGGVKTWLIPNDGSWDDFLGSTDTFTRWGSLTPAQKAGWTGGSPHPIGKTVGYSGHWVCYAKPSGMKLIFR